MSLVTPPQRSFLYSTSTQATPSLHLRQGSRAPPPQEEDKEGAWVDEEHSQWLSAQNRPPCMYDDNQLEHGNEGNEDCFYSEYQYERIDEEIEREEQELFQYVEKMYQDALSGSSSDSSYTQMLPTAESSYAARNESKVNELPQHSSSASTNSRYVSSLAALFSPTSTSASFGFSSLTTKCSPKKQEKDEQSRGADERDQWKQPDDFNVEAQQRSVVWRQASTGISSLSACNGKIWEHTNGSWRYDPYNTNL